MVLNGPNLNRLGTREPEIYGSDSYDDLGKMVERWGKELRLETNCFQTNHEGELIDRIHAAKDQEVSGMVLNPGAFSHTSYALHDAILTASPIPAVEVHISNILEREEWRKCSVTSPACLTSIFGRGIDGYRWALRRIRSQLDFPAETIFYDERDVRKTRSSFIRAIDLRLTSTTAEDRYPLIALLAEHSDQEIWGRDTIDWLAAGLAKAGYPTANIGIRGHSYQPKLEDLQGVRNYFYSNLNGNPKVIWLGYRNGGEFLGNFLQDNSIGEPQPLIWLGYSDERGHPESEATLPWDPNLLLLPVDDSSLDPIGPVWDTLLSWLRKHHPLPATT